MDNKFKKFITSKGFKLIISVLVIIFIYNFYVNYAKISKLESQIEYLHNEIRKAREKNYKLKTELDNLNNLEYIEKIAREELGLVKPGELLLIPVEDKTEKNNEKDGIKNGQ